MQPAELKSVHDGGRGKRLTEDTQLVDNPGRVVQHTDQRNNRNQGVSVMQPPKTSGRAGYPTDGIPGCGCVRLGSGARRKKRGTGEGASI